MIKNIKVVSFNFSNNLDKNTKELFYYLQGYLKRICKEHLFEIEF